MYRKLKSFYLCLAYFGVAGCAVAPHFGTSNAPVAPAAESRTQPVELRRNASGGPPIEALLTEAKPSGKAASPPPANASLKPFNEVVRDFSRKEGLFTVYQRDEKTYLAIKPEQFNQPFFLQISTTHSIGERSFYGAQMSGGYLPDLEIPVSQLVVFRKLPNAVQLVALNTDFMAEPNTPEARAVAQSFSESLMASSNMIARADGKHGEVLVDLAPLLLNDFLFTATRLENVYRQSYTFDRSNSTIEKFKSKPTQSSFDIRAHYALARLNFLPSQVCRHQRFQPPCPMCVAFSWAIASPLCNCQKQPCQREWPMIASGIL